MKNIEINSDEEIVVEFKEGDYICHSNNYQIFPIWFNATDTDVENYSGKNGIYIKKK